MTTDDTGTITNAWRNVDTTVTLSPSDGTGAGLVQTYYTTNGVNPTTGSPTGTSILLTAEGTYTIKYFSTDRVANTEAVKTGAAQIRIDKTNPTSATLNALPAAIRNGQSLTGGGADALSGVGSITYLYCAGAACTPSTVVGSSSTPAGGYPVTWNSQPADGTYRVRARVFDAAGNQLDSAIQTVTIDNTNPTGCGHRPGRRRERPRRLRLGHLQLGRRRLRRRQRPLPALPRRRRHLDDDRRRRHQLPLRASPGTPPPSPTASTTCA